MNPTPLFRMVDRIVGGNLAETIRKHRDEGLTPDQISLRLFADHQLEIPGRTMRRWVDALETNGDEAA